MASHACRVQELDVEGVREVVSQGCGWSPSAVWPSCQRNSVVRRNSCACVLVSGVRVRAVIRLEHWRRRRAGRSSWTAAPGIAWLVLPVALLVGLVPLVSATTGRVFTFRQLSLAMPGPVALITVAAITGAALAVARVAALAADRRERRRR